METQPPLSQKAKNNIFGLVVANSGTVYTANLLSVLNTHSGHLLDKEQQEHLRDLIHVLYNPECPVIKQVIADYSD